MKVLSTTTTAPCARAASESARRSAMRSIGFVGVSRKSIAAPASISRTVASVSLVSIQVKSSPRRRSTCSPTR